MEEASVLVTDFREGFCFDLLEFLTVRKTIPYILIKEFENVHEVYNDFPTAIPIVLDYQHNTQSTVNHLSLLPTFFCIFTFDAETFEDLYRQNFDHFTKTVVTSLDHFDEASICKEMMEALSDGYTLIVKFIPYTKPMSNPLILSVEASLLKNNLIPATATTSTTSTDGAINSSRNLKFVFEKLFFRQQGILGGQKVVAQRNEDPERRFVSPGRERTSIGDFFRRMFNKFNPCSTISVMDLIPTRSTATTTSIKSPEEINKYIRLQENNEIRQVFQTIHNSALTNWTDMYEKKFQVTPLEYEKRYEAMCKDIARKGEEGRKLLMENVNKDIERTRQWDHVLGAKTIDRLRMAREREVEVKVQNFSERKKKEAKEKIIQEIEETKSRTKFMFYSQILEEQIMELTRIKSIYQKRKELLMLPHTGEFKILQ